MEINQLFHTTILVTDLERSEQFYGTILGLAKIERPLKYPGVWYQIGHHQIHLILAPSVPTQNQNQKWSLNPHMAFSVLDLTTAQLELQNQNVTFQTSSSGRRAIFIQDPDGNIVELAQAG